MPVVGQSPGWHYASDYGLVEAVVAEAEQDRFVAYTAVMNDTASVPDSGSSAEFAAVRQVGNVVGEARIVVENESFLVVETLFAAGLANTQAVDSAQAYEADFGVDWKSYEEEFAAALASGGFAAILAYHSYAQGFADPAWQSYAWVLGHSAYDFVFRETAGLSASGSDLLIGQPSAVVPEQSGATN